jgi:hypothetical protein
MPEVATLTTSTTRAKRRYTRITPALHARLVRLKARRLTPEEIANRVGISEATVSRVLKKPISPTQFTDLSRRLDLSRYDKQAARERVKDYLAARLITTLDKAFDLAEQTLGNGHARGFAHAMTGIEKLNRVSGNTVGEGRHVLHEGVPQTPSSDFRTLMQELGVIRS